MKTSPPEQNKSKRPTIDWESVEKDWRAGIKTKQQISKEYGVSRAAMDKHFAKLGIERNLKEKILDAADALVTREMVTREVTPLDPVTEKEIVAVNAQAIAMVQMRHRSDIARGRDITIKLLEELELMCSSHEELAQLAKMLGDSEKISEKTVERFHKLVGHNNRVGSIKQLSETLKNLIELERKVFKIDDKSEDPIEAAARGAAHGAAKGTNESSNSILAGLIAELSDVETSA